MVFACRRGCGAVNALLVAYLALFPALFALVVRHTVTRLGPPALLASPLVWVATELGRGHLFSGFPWVLLGYSQASVLPIAQLASLIGVYGVSALVAGGSACVAAVLMSTADRTGSRRQISNQASRYAPLLVLLALIVVIAGWGRFRIARGELTRAGEQVRVGLVQGNVDQAEKWDPARAAANLSELSLHTRQAVDGGATIVLWPESSTPVHFAEQPEQAAR